MRLPHYPIFGQSNSTAITGGNLFGRPNFFNVPPGYTVWTDSEGQIWASPNADHSDPQYACFQNISGELVFQSAMLSTISGSSRG